MNIRRCFTVVCTTALLTSATGITAQANKSDTPNVSDGFVKVESHQLDAVYLLPGTDFRGYTKVLLDQGQVEFRNDWIKEINRSTRELSNRIGAEDAKQFAEEARASFGETFGRAIKDAGYDIVTAQGADVLRLTPRVVDMYINAPDKLTTALRTRVFTVAAGEATLVLEIRDSTTGTLLGHATDRRTAVRYGGNRVSIASSVSNRGDFEDLFGIWAQLCVEVFKELKAQPPAELSRHAATQ